jgi:hypothetical protein
MILSAADRNPDDVVFAPFFYELRTACRLNIGSGARRELNPLPFCCIRDPLLRTPHLSAIENEGESGVIRSCVTSCGRFDARLTRTAL